MSKCVNIIKETEYKNLYSVQSVSLRDKAVLIKRYIFSFSTSVRFESITVIRFKNTSSLLAGLWFEKNSESEMLNTVHNFSIVRIVGFFSFRSI